MNSFSYGADSVTEVMSTEKVGYTSVPVIDEHEGRCGDDSALSDIVLLCMNFFQTSNAVHWVYDCYKRIMTYLFTYIPFGVIASASQVLGSISILIRFE